MSSSTVLDEVIRYKKALESSPSDEEILEVYRLLDGIEVDRTLLSRTKIGIAVTKHKQHENPDVATKSRRLVDKWRAVVSSTHLKSSNNNSKTAPSLSQAVEASSTVSGKDSSFSL